MSPYTSSTHDRHSFLIAKQSNIALPVFCVLSSGFSLCPCSYSPSTFCEMTLTRFLQEILIKFEKEADGIKAWIDDDFSWAV